MDKKKMEELMKKRVAPMPDRQVVKSVDLLKPATAEQAPASVLQETNATNNQTTEAVNISAAKAVNIQEALYEIADTGKKRGRPRSLKGNLVHFSTWLPEELTWLLRAKAVALHKKDYEVVAEAIATYLEGSK
jgi:hypothetical protein